MIDWRETNVLVLEDDPDYFEFLMDLISQGQTELRYIEHAQTLKQALHLLERNTFDVALLDLHVPDSAGLGTLHRVREKAPSLPVVVLTAQQELDYEDRALQAGAQEFLLKEEAMPRLLFRVMRYAIERMRTNIELREIEQRQRIILDSTQVGLVVIDPDTHVIVDANTAALKMLDRQRNEVIGKSCHSFICPSKKNECPITDLGKSFERSEREIIVAGGHTLPVLKTVNNITLDSRPHLLEAFIDFTEIKEAREVLEASKKKLAEAVEKRTKQLKFAKKQWEDTFDAVPDLISIHDKDYKIIRVNKALAERLNMDISSIIGKSCFEVMHNEKNPLSICPHTNSLKDGKTQIAEIFESKLDGDFLVSTSPLKDENGEVFASVHVARDISDLKNVGKKLENQLKFMNTVIETIPNPIFIKDCEGIYTICNKAFADFWNVPKDKIIGKKTDEIVSQESARIIGQQDEILFQKPGVQFFEVPFEIPGRGVRQAIYYKATFEDNQGKVAGLVGVVHDITERKQMEEQLARSQKLEAIGLLAAGIAHEINTPTQFIHTNVEFLAEAFNDCSEVVNQISIVTKGLKEGKPRSELLQEVLDDFDQNEFAEMREEVQDALNGTLEGVERITRIVDSMRYFSHPGSDKKELLDINNAIEHAITVSKNEWKYYADIVTDLDANLPQILGYSAPLNQVLLNIIVNAAQAISDSIGDSPERKGKISISTQQADKMVEIRIVDNGPGIDEKVIPNIFDPFFTTKKIGKGTGQGLALAHSVVVDKHEGSIEVKSRLGEGATFIIQLPIEC